MDVFYNKLEADPSTIGMDVVGGRLDLVSATSIKWGFQNSNQIRLVNPDTGRWELVKCATEPTIANTALDMNGTALAVDKIYDVFAEYSSSTAFTLVASRWASYGAGTSSRVAAYASGTTYAIGDRVTYGGHDWVKQSTAAAGTTPVAGNDWVDNGTSVSGDFSGLYRHDGVLVSDSSTTGKSRRWLGIIYTYNNSGTVNFKDETSNRYISNFYNSIRSLVYSYNTNDTWTVPTTVSSWRECNNGLGQLRGKYVCCKSNNYMAAAFTNIVQGSTVGNCGMCIFNSSTNPDYQFFGGQAIGAIQTCSMNVSMPIRIGLGYISIGEIANGVATYTVRSYNGSNCGVTLELPT